jgi:predicted secreted hydrolase
MSQQRIILLFFALCSGLAAVGLSETPPGVPRGTADASPWKSVVEPRQFVFPRDHAAHEDYRIEWWYYTGNLQTAEGRHFGYQLTFFRTGLNYAPRNPSRWSVRDLYVAHFAISDIAAEEFTFRERVARGGVGWAGADRDDYHAWNGDWSARLAGDDHILTAAEGPAKIELVLTPGKPPVLHGRQRMHSKGDAPGNASYYYSLTRMETRGSLSIGGKTYTVTGQSWMDHEFSSSFLEAGQQGWDWFALVLDDGSELMLYQMRRNDGTRDRHSSGTLVHPDGTWETVSQAEFTLTAGRKWTSPASNAAYPIAWNLRIPGHKMDLEVRAAFPSQELNSITSTGFPYWEGSIVVSGTRDGKPLAGRGYLEMTGYHPGFGHLIGRHP